MDGGQQSKTNTLSALEAENLAKNKQNLNSNRIFVWCNKVKDSEAGSFPGIHKAFPPVSTVRHFQTVRSTSPRVCGRAGEEEEDGEGGM